MIHLSDSEKIEAFDRISECFLQQNFGSVGKSDLELMFFSIVIEHLLKHDLPYDDYTISKLLGITQQRVRNLKVKNQLRYEHSFDWKNALLSKVSNASFSPDDRFIIVFIDDPNLSIEVQHYIEANGGHVDYTLNPKLLKMNTRDFAKLLVEIGSVDHEKEVWKALRQVYREENEDIGEITKDTIGTRLKNGTFSMVKEVITGIVVECASKCLPIGQ